MVNIILGERVGRGGRIGVGCSAAVFDESRQCILLARRADNGCWTVPGGYMDPGESLTEACVREVREETGLEVRVVRLVGIYTNPHFLLEYLDGNRWQLVVLHFEAELVGGALQTSDETTALGYFSQTEVARLEMSALDRLRVADAFAGQAAAIVRDVF